MYVVPLEIIKQEIMYIKALQPVINQRLTITVQMCLSSTFYL
jgi:hypothetical protein